MKNSSTNTLVGLIAWGTLITTPCALAMLHDKVPSERIPIPDYWSLWAGRWQPIEIKSEVEKYLWECAAGNHPSKEYPPGTSKQTPYDFNYIAYKARFFDMNIHFINHPPDQKRKA